MVIIYLYVQNTWIEVEQIEVGLPKLSENLRGMKIAHLSDLHIPQNGPSIDTIIKKVKAEAPDVIVITGDIIDKRCNFDEVLFEKFCSGIAKVAPTYVVTGNHEIWRGNLQVWHRILSDNNMVVIDSKISVITHKGSDIALIGMRDGVEFRDSDYDVHLQIRNLPKILLTHRPESYTSGMKDEDLIKPDIVVSGHIHGGQFIIPFTKIGILSPNIKLFPKYISGLYRIKKDINLVMSRGLGNSIIPFRINNRPHLIIIKLKEMESSDIIK